MTNKKEMENLICEGNWYLLRVTNNPLIFKFYPDYTWVNSTD